MNIIGRAEWGATGTQSRYGRMRLPASALVLHHTVTAVSKDPAKDMRIVERVGMQRFGQTSYSYAVHPDGTVLEGAGRLIGAHTAKRNSSSFGVALIGNYDERSVTVWQIDAVRHLVAWLIDNGDLRPGTYPTAGHRDIIGAKTACPGAKAYRLMDAFRVPWNDQPAAKGEITVPDNADLHNITGPVTYTFIVATDGTVKGYYCWSAGTAELHAYGDVPFFGRSEVV